MQSSDTSPKQSSLSEIENRIDDQVDVIDQATAETSERENANTPDNNVRHFHLGNLSPKKQAAKQQPIDLLGEVELDLKIELGRTKMSLQEVLQLRGGSVVALDALVGDPVNVYVNGRIVARGEVLVMNDNFCVRVTELVGA